MQKQFCLCAIDTTSSDRTARAQRLRFSILRERHVALPDTRFFVLLER